MKEFPVKNIKTGCFFTDTVYLDAGYPLLSPEMAFSEEIAALLDEWHFEAVLSNGTEREFLESDYSKNLVQNDESKIEQARAFLDELETWTTKLFIKFSTGGGGINFEMVAEKVSQLCKYVKENRKYILQAPKNGVRADDEAYYATHCVWSAIISIIIGAHLKLPNHRLIELGAAALCHEIGMLKLPAGLYREKSVLTDKEKELLIMHPKLGYELLKSCNFPPAVCVPALEHHERENGSGYPRGLSKDRAALYSKIIMVAGSYVAMTENRPHRDARMAYEGITDLLKNESKQYDESVLRAFVLSLSIYPIGQDVELSNGRKGRVIDTNPEDPRYPIVQIFNEQTPDGKNKFIETSATGVFVARPLGKDEI
ncbi:MAG: HD-GYP domain-containing protein [Spirochaetaceae bacterium]|jgi:HD-GYP domain-containing protein (c-di-GMP phosphodiesterase class II)|nr:HD-GYP domain-containing protein [Spirochaetaceae bacterium]